MLNSLFLSPSLSLGNIVDKTNNKIRLHFPGSSNIFDMWLSDREACEGNLLASLIEDYIQLTKLNIVKIKNMMEKNLNNIPQNNFRSMSRSYPSGGGGGGVAITRSQQSNGNSNPTLNPNITRMSSSDGLNNNFTSNINDVNSISESAAEVNMKGKEKVENALSCKSSTTSKTNTSAAKCTPAEKKEKINNNMP